MRYSGFIYGLKVVEHGINGLGTAKGIDHDEKFSTLDGQANGANGSNGMCLVFLF